MICSLKPSKQASWNWGWLNVVRTGDVGDLNTKVGCEMDKELSFVVSQNARTSAIHFQNQHHWILQPILDIALMNGELVKSRSSLQCSVVTANSPITRRVPLRNIAYNRVIGIGYRGPDPVVIIETSDVPGPLFQNYPHILMRPLTGQAPASWRCTSLYTHTVSPLQ